VAAVAEPVQLAYLWRPALPDIDDALRLQPSLLQEARKLAESEGVALNQLINLAVAEKVSALRTESYIGERGARANIPKALRILKRAGVGQRPVKGDELSRSHKKRSV
jgi:hypothetical protein